MSKSYCFENVRVYAQGKLGKPQSFWVENGTWVAGPVAGAEHIVMNGAWVLPGLFALGVDFQEPVRDDIYTLKDGFEAMRRGGFAAALYESHANPADDIHKFKSMQDACGKSGLEFYFLGALSVENQGKALAEMLELAASGVVGFGDGDSLPTNLKFIRLALEYAAMTGLRCYFQPTERTLAGKGCVHEGHFADTLGMKGVPAQAETIAVYQILELAGWLQVPVHLKQLTCAESLNLVRQARKKGVDVTCDTSIYHLLFDDSCLFDLDTNTHLKPVLRTAEDRAALWAGLVDGSIQAVSCAHTPVLPQDKEVNFEEAAPGAVSLEIALSALHSLAKSKLGAEDSSWIAWLSSAAAEVAGTPAKAMQQGQDCPFLVFDPNATFTVANNSFAGQVQNSPLLGQTLSGKVLGTCFDQVWRPNP